MEIPESNSLAAGLFNPILNRNSDLVDIINFANTMAKISEDTLKYIDHKIEQQLRKREVSNFSDKIFVFMLYSKIQESLDRFMYELMDVDQKRLFRNQNDEVFTQLFYSFSKDSKTADESICKILSTLFYGTDKYNQLTDSTLGKQFSAPYFLKRFFFKKQFQLIEDFEFDFQDIFNGNFRDQQHTILIHLKRILLSRKKRFIASALPSLSDIRTYKNKDSKAYFENKEIKEYLRGTKESVGLIEALNHSFDFLELNSPLSPPQIENLLTTKKGKGTSKNIFDIEAIDKTIKTKRKEITANSAIFKAVSVELVRKVKKKKPAETSWLDIDADLDVMNSIAETWRNRIKSKEIAEQKIVNERTRTIDGTKKTEEEVILTTDQMIKAIYDKVYEKKEAEKFKEFKDFVNDGKWSTLTPKEKHEYWGKHGAQLMAAAASNLGVALGTALLSPDPKDRIKAFEDFGKSLLLEQGTELLGLLGTLWGGPIVGSFVQGLAGALLGGILGSEKPDPLKDIQNDIRDLKKDIHQLSKEMRLGFNNVFKQNNVIIEQNVQLEQLVKGISDLIKYEFNDLKDFISLLGTTERLKSKIDRVDTSIDLLEKSYNGLFYSNGDLKFIEQSEIIDALNDTLREFTNENLDINDVPVKFEPKDFDDGILVKLIEHASVQKSGAATDFATTTRNIIRLCDMADLLFNRYANNIDEHFSNNAIIAFAEPNALQEKHTNNFIDNVLRPLVKMQKLKALGLKGALASYGSTFKSTVVGKGNMHLFNAYLHAQIGEKPTAFDGLFAGKLADDGTIIFEKEGNSYKEVPLMLHFDEKSNVSFRSEMSRIYVDGNKEGKYTGFTYKNGSNYNAIFPIKTRECKFYLGKYDVLFLHHNQLDKIRILPPDSKFILDEKVTISPFEHQWENIFYRAKKIYLQQSTTISYFDQKETVKNQDNSIHFGDIRFDISKTNYLDKADKEGSYITFERSSYDTFKIIKNVYKENQPEDEDSKDPYDLLHIDPITTKYGSKKYGNRIFSKEDVSYSDNLKYRITGAKNNGQFQVEKLEKDAYGQDSWTSIWQSTLFDDKKKDTTGQLILKPCNAFENNLTLQINITKVINFPMPQYAIKELFLTDDGVLKVNQDLEAIDNRVKDSERRFIVHSLYKGECLYADEFIYTKYQSYNSIQFLQMQTDGNLVLYNSDLHSDTKVINHKDPQWSTNTNGEYDHKCVLMITQDCKLEILAKKLYTQGDKKFTFPQRHVENLYVSNNEIKINDGLGKKHKKRRLFLYGLKTGDIMYPEEKIISPNRKYYFMIQNDGNMRCKAKGKTWYSMIYKSDANPLKFEFKHGGNTFELFYDENRFSGFFTFWGYTQYREELQHLWASDKNMHKSYTHITESNMYAIIMDDSGYLLAQICNSDEKKIDSFDIGLVSSKNQHKLPKMKPISNIAKYLGF